MELLCQSLEEPESNELYVITAAKQEEMEESADKNHRQPEPEPHLLNGLHNRLFGFQDFCFGIGQDRFPYSSIADRKKE